jgi:Na+/alanine symporter
MRKIFRWAFCLVIVFGFFEAELLWSLADLLNASIVIVNGAAMIFLVKYAVEKKPGHRLRRIPTTE